MGLTTWPPPKPEASCLSDYEWHQQAQLARHYASFDEPFRVDEGHGGLKLTWLLEEGREPRLERLSAIDPDADSRLRVEAWLHDRVVGTIGGVPHVAVPLVVVATVLIAWLTHNLLGRGALVIACGLATIAIAPLVWRTRRLWRTQEFRSFSPADREQERAARRLVAEHAAAWRDGDRAARDAVARRLWTQLPRGD